jgi:hypothetical protein
MDASCATQTGLLQRARLEEQLTSGIRGWGDVPKWRGGKPEDSDNYKERIQSKAIKRDPKEYPVRTAGTDAGKALPIKAKISC